MSNDTKKDCIIPVLQILIGLPGAGKSTYCHQFTDKSIILATDDLREKQFGPRHSEQIREWVFNKLLKLILENLQKKKDIIADTTFFNTINDRHRLFGLLDKARIKVRLCAVVFDVDLEECLRRNKQRLNERVVDSKFITNMAKKMDIPTSDEHFDDVQIIRQARS